MLDVAVEVVEIGSFRVMMARQVTELVLVRRVSRELATLQVDTMSLD